MKTKSITLVLFILSTAAFSAKFPHKTVISESITTGPMMEVITNSYASYDGNEDTAISAEWVTQKTPAGKKRLFNLTKKGFVYAVDMDTKHCTKTNVKAITGSISDPEEFAESMKQQMGLVKAGSCEGAGLKGDKYTSSFGEMCFYKESFLLWQKMMGASTKVTKVKFDASLPKDKITLPSGIKCVDGPDLSKGFGNMRSPGSSNESKYKSIPDQQSSPKDMDDAMKKANDAMKMLGDYFKKQ